jgi:hypothetical protein
LEPDGVDLAGALIANMLAAEQLAMVVEAFSLILAVAADDRDYRELALRMLVLLPAQEVRKVVVGIATSADEEAVATLAVLLTEEPLRSGWAATRQLLIGLVLLTAARSSGEPLGQALRTVFAALSTDDVVQVLGSREIRQAASANAVSAAAMLEAAPAGLIQELVQADVDSAALLLNLALSSWYRQVDPRQRHEPRIAATAEILAMHRSDPDRTLDLLDFLLANYPAGAAILFNIAEGNSQTITAAATLLTALLQGRPKVVQSVARLTITAEGLPTQVFDKIVAETPAMIEPVLCALVTESDTRAELRRILSSEAEVRTNPNVSLRLLELLAEQEPDGPWAYAADKLNSGEPEQVGSIIATHASTRSRGP